MPDRLDYIKQKLEEYKKSPAVILRHSDGEWAVGEIEQLRADNNRLVDRVKMYEKRAVHLAAVNDQLRDDNNTNQALLDILYLIAPDKIEEAIDAQKESDKQ
jgi:FtsZ-binding cell division protein ZapB